MLTPSTERLHEVIRQSADRLLAIPVPGSTYRIQFNHAFTFEMAERIVPYLSDLGITHLYASPLFMAMPGSMHGYDVVDFNRLNPEIGTEDQFRSLVTALHRHGMHLILDFVPNHMGIEGGRNAWWQDVLEHGQQSRFAEYFDIEWTPIKNELRGKVLLPFLGDQYGRVLEHGELALGFSQGAFTIRYWDTPFPVSPVTYPRILRLVEERLAQVLDPDSLDFIELQSISAALDGVERMTSDVDGVDPRDMHGREQLLAKHRLDQLVSRSSDVADAISQVVTQLNGQKDDPGSFDALDDLLDAQPYRLSFWRVAAEEINYRRFFAINTLAAIRQEEKAVFRDTHGLLVSLIGEGLVDGVRIDHPDGLWDPAAYFRDLQRAVLVEMGRRTLENSTREPSDPDLEYELHNAAEAYLDQRLEAGEGVPLYIVAEKILEHGESLREDWAVAGTVGYEFAQVTTGVFVNQDARVLFDRIYSRFTGDRVRYPDLVYEMKQRMMRDAFASEVNVLSRVLNRMSEDDRHSRDFTLNSIRDTLREIIASFSVYRTYIACDRDEGDSLDQHFIEMAVALGKRLNPTMDASVFDFIAAILIGDVESDSRVPIERNCRFAMRLQQLSGPIMAKGVEDTAFYRFNRLTSLNEVGGQPNRFGTNVEEFHRQNRARLRRWPDGMINSSTHDTKRSEDVRARINVLSEVPTEWRAAVNRWSRLNRKLKRKIDGVLAPQRGDEYVVYQTLIGTTPFDDESGEDWATYTARISEYMIKVGREANRLTNWVNPNEEYERALTDFVDGMFDRRRSRLFLEDLEGFSVQVRDGGWINGLAQQLLKLTSPGVPDLYQGTELWDDSLVDPDNRRSVDYDRRIAVLDNDEPMSELWSRRSNGAVKLHLTRRALAVRGAHPETFSRGDYVPLVVTGPAADHVIAFARRDADHVVIVVVPRLSVKLAGSSSVLITSALWSGTHVVLPDDPGFMELKSALTDAFVVPLAGDDARLLDVESLFSEVPVALIVST